MGEYVIRPEQFRKRSGSSSRRSIRPSHRVVPSQLHEEWKAMGGDERLAANDDEKPDILTLMLREAALNWYRPDMHFKSGGVEGEHVCGYQGGITKPISTCGLVELIFPSGNSKKGRRSALTV